MATSFISLWYPGWTKSKSSRGCFGRHDICNCAGTAESERRQTHRLWRCEVRTRLLPVCIRWTFSLLMSSEGSCVRPYRTTLVPSSSRVLFLLRRASSLCETPLHRPSGSVPAPPTSLARCPPVAEAAFQPPHHPPRCRPPLSQPLPPRPPLWSSPTLFLPTASPNPNSILGVATTTGDNPLPSVAAMPPLPHATARTTSAPPPSSPLPPPPGTRPRRDPPQT
jgi:hypothetical protein